MAIPAISRMGIGVVAATALTLAACSSGGSGSATGQSAGAAPASGAAPTGAPIQIMVTGSLSSPTFSVPEIVPGAQAAADDINARGGVNGHPIKILSCNDQANPNQAAQCAQQAVSSKATAVTGFFLFGPQLFDPTSAAHIPVLDPSPVSSQPGTASNSYPVSGGTYPAFVGIGQALVKKGDTHVVILEGNTAASTLNGNWAKQGVEAAGGTVVRTVVATIGSPDYSPYVRQALQGGKTQAIIWVVTQQDLPNFILAAKQAGFSGDIGTAIGEIPPSDAKKVSGSGLSIMATSNYLVPPAPQASAYAKDMAKYAPKAEIDEQSEGTWAAVEMVANALKGKSGTDAAALTAALNASTSATAGPIMDSINFTKSSGVPQNPRLYNPDVVVMQVTGGTYRQQGDFFNPFAK